MKYLVQLFIIGFILAATKFVNCRPFRTPVSAGLSGISTVLSDVHSLFENPAQNLDIKYATVGTSVINHYGIAALRTYTCSAVIPLKNIHSASFHYYRAGTGNFFRQELLLSYALKVSEKFNLGVQAERKYNTYHSEFDRNISAWCIRIGITSTPIPGLDIGLVINNPNKSHWNDFGKTSLPSSIHLGTKISLSDKVNTFLQANLETGIGNDLIAAIEYSPVKQARFRTGINSTTKQPSFGTGFDWKNTCIDFSINFHSHLGISPGISISQKIR